ncbi:hypothetical protein ACFWY9_10300 [Amycolatopsis sp. NPDC059027]|uniref:hypothetical protein n=1 Tax=Amycolatopsis sp. NPDC059027 TaxID=3346709 RepID=UPI00366D9E5C
MAHRTGTVHAEVIPDHTMIIILGTGFDTVVRPDFDSRRLCHGVTDMLYLLSSSSSMHYTTVTLEAWTAEPDQPAASEPWEEHDETRLRLTRGRVYISAMLEGPLTPELDLDGPGDYHIRVHATGRERLLHLERDEHTDPDDMHSGVEHFLVQLWPASAG